MTSDRRLIGKINRSAGTAFEEFIQRSCDIYQEKGLAYIQKTPEPMHIIRSYGRNGWFVANFSKRAQPDFKGCLNTGQTVIFDAKHTTKDRIQQSVVSDAQAEYFDGYEEMGAECFILVSINLQTFHRVPWIVWKNMKAIFGHKYMNEEELKEYKVPGTIGMIRFLEAEEKKMKGGENAER